MKIYLIRHAQQESPLCNDNTRLSRLGREEADKLSKRLNKYNIEQIYSSDLLRAIETAEIIKKGLSNSSDVELKISKDLRETEFGDLTRLSDDVIAVRYADFMESRHNAVKDWAYPQGECGEEVFIRANKVLQEILISNKKSIAVITHGGTIRCILAQLFQGGQAKRLNFGKNFRRASITELLYDEKKARFYLERFNDYAHLEEV